MRSYIIIFRKITPVKAKAESLMKTSPLHYKNIICHTLTNERRPASLMMKNTNYLIIDTYFFVVLFHFFRGNISIVVGIHLPESILLSEKAAGHKNLQNTIPEINSFFIILSLSTYTRKFNCNIREIDIKTLS